MDNPDFKPFVPPDQTPPELTLRAVLLGMIMAVVLGAANAYLGLRAGQTVAATFPAAVVAMAVLKVFKGSILEENIARTTASVGEALVAGAIFTIPAFIIAGIWDSFNYIESTLLMLVGGLLGVLFVVLLRRSLVNDKTLPFPESVAAAEIHKAGQKGASGAKHLFYMMGLGAVIELLKNGKGIQLFTERITSFWQYGTFKSHPAVGRARSARVPRNRRLMPSVAAGSVGVEGLDLCLVLRRDRLALQLHGRSEFVAAGQPLSGDDLELLDLLDPGHLGVGFIDRSC